MNQMMGWGGGFGTLSFVFWVTALLSWAILALVIVALWKWVNKK